VDWNSPLNQAAVIGAVTYSGVTQTTPTNFNAAVGTSVAPSVTVTSQTGHVVFGVVSGRARSIYAVTGGGTLLWAQTPVNNQTAGSGQSATGATPTVSLGWSSTLSDEWVAGGVTLRPAPASGASSTTFTQSPPFALSFTMPSNSLIQITNFVTVVTGAMPASPTNIWAIMSYAGTNFITLTNAAYNSGTSNLVWTGTLTNNVNIGSNQTISLTVTTFQSGVSFKLDYGSSNKMSKILLPTTNVIAITDFGIFDAPYPVTNRLTGAANGALVSMPFGNSNALKATPRRPL
jgi:hypothetical protein